MSRGGQSLVLIPDDVDTVCQTCGREFEPLRLAIHSRVCGRIRERPLPEVVSAQRQADGIRKQAWAMLEQTASQEVIGITSQQPPVPVRQNPGGLTLASAPAGRENRTPDMSARRVPMAKPRGITSKRSSISDALYDEGEMLEGTHNGPDVAAVLEAGSMEKLVHKKAMHDHGRPMSSQYCQDVDEEDEDPYDDHGGSLPMNEAAAPPAPASRASSRTSSRPPSASAPGPMDDEVSQDAPPHPPLRQPARQPPPAGTPALAGSQPTAAPASETPRELPLRSEYPTGNLDDMFEPEEAPAQVPCDVCGRRFNVNRLERHIAICAKLNTKKRKVFGESAERLKLQEKFAAEAAKEAETKQAKKPLWKTQSEQFQSAMKNARAVQAGEPPPESEPVEDTRVPCPHCGRKFEALVAERHIPKCATTKAKPNAVGTPMRRQSSTSSKSLTNAAAPAAAPQRTEPRTPAREKDKGDTKEAQLNPRQIIEAKKAAEKAAEMQSPNKSKGARRSSTPGPAVRRPSAVAR